MNDEENEIVIQIPADHDYGAGRKVGGRLELVDIIIVRLGHEIARMEVSSAQHAIRLLTDALEALRREVGSMTAEPDEVLQLSAEQRADRAEERRQSR